MQYLTFEQIIVTLRARWLSVVIVVALSVALGAAAILVLPKRYQAAASVLLDVKSADPISGLMMQGVLAGSYTKTQMEVLGSDAVAQRVVRTLALEKEPEWVANWEQDAPGSASFEAWAAEVLSRGLDVSTGRDSSLIRVAFTSRDPAFAAKVANAWVKAYADTLLELRVAPARQYKEFFDVSASQLREALEVAQKKLSDFERRNGLIVNEERLDVEIGRLDAMNAQLVLLMTQATDSQSRRKQSLTESDSTQEALGSKLVGDLRADLQRARSRLSELSPQLGERYPEVVQLKAQIAELEIRIEEETRRISRGIDMSSRVGRQRLSEMQAAVERQRAKVLKGKASRDEAYVLQRDVENAQKAYENVLSRSSQMSLESQTGQTNALAVGRASVPNRPSSPRVLLILVAATGVGLLAGFLLALIRERTDQRIRTDAQAAAILRQPLVGVLPRFQSRQSNRIPRLAAPAGRRARRLVST